MKIKDIASLLLRVSLAGGFLSAVASRLGLWGIRSSGWSGFLDYAAQVNSFAPKSAIPAIAITSTVLETGFGLMLLIGYQTKNMALGSATLSFLFAVAMSYSFGIKEPLDYSVFAFSAGALLLAATPGYRWSVDQLINKNQ